MIKQVDEIPRGRNMREKTQRQEIREDIDSAIEQGINKFEFVGESYNYKTLAGTAQEESRRIYNEKVRSILKKDKKYALLSVSEIVVTPPIVVTSIKSDKQGERRVFCSINFDGFEERVLDAADDAYERHELRRKQREEKAAIKEQG